MTNFANYHCGSWKDGQLAVTTAKIMVVSYDQKNDAYVVDDRDLSEFFDWVSKNWELSRDPRARDDDGDYTESAEEYLERVGIAVRER